MVRATSGPYMMSAAASATVLGFWMVMRMPVLRRFLTFFSYWTAYRSRRPCLMKPASGSSGGSGAGGGSSVRMLPALSSTSVKYRASSSMEQPFNVLFGQTRHHLSTVEVIPCSCYDRLGATVHV